MFIKWLQISESQAAVYVKISDKKNLTEVEAATVRVSMETFLRRTINNDVDIDWANILIISF